MAFQPPSTAAPTQPRIAPLLHPNPLLPMDRLQERLDSRSAMSIDANPTAAAATSDQQLHLFEYFGNLELAAAQQPQPPRPSWYAGTGVETSPGYDQASPPLPSSPSPGEPHVSFYPGPANTYRPSLRDRRSSASSSNEAAPTTTPEERQVAPQAGRVPVRKVSQRRRDQNRAAQKAMRERKKQQAQDQQAQVAATMMENQDLRQQIFFLNQRYADQSLHIQQLQAEIQHLRQAAFGPPLANPACAAYGRPPHGSEVQGW